MSTESAVLRQIDEVFGPTKRPAHFTNYEHCEECREYDDLLRSRDRSSLTLSDLTARGDPFCFVSSQGLAYYLPSLARLALSGKVNDAHGYAPQLLFLLWSEGPANSHLLSFTTEQKYAVQALLGHLLESRSDCDPDHVRHAIENWSKLED
jgi:hypothetical protein